MTFVGWNLLLVASKWVLIGLIYAVLFIFLFAVRREMSMRIAGKGTRQASSLGRLKVIEAGRSPSVLPGTSFNLRMETSLGAASDNDILLDDPYISSHHARLRWDGATWWVEDLGSRNGTSIGGRPCLRRVPAPLAAGSYLKVGEITLELEEPE